MRKSLIIPSSSSYWTWESGRSTSDSHPHSSKPPSCQTLRSNWVQRIWWRAASWQRTHIPPRQPDAPCRSSPYRDFWGSSRQYRHQIWNSLLFRFRPSHWGLFRGPTRADHTVSLRITRSGTLVGNLDGPHNLVNLFEVFELGGEPTVHTDDLFVDDGADWHHVEAVREDLPEFEVVPPFT